MNLKTGVAIFGLLGMLSVAQAADAPADACGTRKMTKKVDKPLLEAQKARADKNWDEVIAKVTEAEAVPVEKSAYDLFWIHEFRGIANVNLKRYPEALKDLGPGF